MEIVFAKSASWLVVISKVDWILNSFLYQMICSYQKIERLHKTEPIGLQRGTELGELKLYLFYWHLHSDWANFVGTPSNNSQSWFLKLEVSQVISHFLGKKRFMSKWYCPQYPFYHDRRWDKQEWQRAHSASLLTMFYFQGLEQICLCLHHQFSVYSRKFPFRLWKCSVNPIKPTSSKSLCYKLELKFW